MRRTLTVIPALLAAACVQETETATLYLPEGDPVAGRAAFADMRCYVCHAVVGDTFPSPHASPPVPVALGPDLLDRPRGSIVEAIIAPSHQIPPDDALVRHGDMSRMGDYGDAMTVRQLIDIAAYLRTLGGS